MNSIDLFKKIFLKDCDERESPMKVVNMFQDNKTIYILYNGLIKEKMKTKIEKYFSQDSREKIYVSLVKSRKELQNEFDNILLDTYVWCKDEPKHTIHYTSTPHIMPRRVS